tara:strand:+ start:657 stop:869 length:213 start_codon:yes stop_codon:yes gene_type:complete
MHIDKYKIYSYGKTWKDGKQSKKEEITHMLTSDECIDGKSLLRLIDDLDDAWHRHEGKEVEVEITFKERV